MGAGTAATLTLTSSIASGIAPAAATLTATVAGATLTGNIVFKDGAATLGTVVINKSKAVLTTTLGVGIHRLVAVYTSAGATIGSPELDVVVDNGPVCK
jgi:O-antigen ligase